MGITAHKRLIRGAAVLLAGLLLAAASAAFLWWIFIRVNPETASLAYRIDATRVQLFLRTQDRATLQRVASLFARSISPAPPPVVASLPPARSFEYAIITRPTGSGAAWVIEAHKEGGSSVTLISENDPSVFLPLKDMRRSLGQEGFFERNARENTANLLLIHLPSLPLAESPAASLLRAAVSPYRHALLLWNSQESGELLLEERTKSSERLMTGIPPALFYPNPYPPLLEIRSVDLSSAWNRFAGTLASENAPLAEGLTGILRATEQEYTRSTDLQSLMEDLLSHPSTMMVMGGSGGRLSLVLAGTATHEEDIDRWTDALASALTPGTVRSLRFFRENARTDVIPTAESAINRDRTAQGWSLTHVGASGSVLAITVARRNRSFIASNDEQTILQLIEGPPSTIRDRSTTEGGSFYLPWTFAWLDHALPFLAKDIRTLSSTLFGPSAQRLSWQSTSGGGIVRIRWSLL